MIAIHPIHRRMAELDMLRRRRPLRGNELLELFQCVRMNTDLVIQLDSLKQLAFHAHLIGDTEWEMEICRKIDELEASFL